MVQDVENNAESGEVEVVFQEISGILEKARSKVYRAVNIAMVQSYWEIGRVIADDEYDGRERAEYGGGLLRKLSQKLTAEYGRGFKETNLRYMRLFFIAFPIHHALRDELTWTHYRLLLKVENPKARDFYTQESLIATGALANSIARLTRSYSKDWLLAVTNSRF